MSLYDPHFDCPEQIARQFVDAQAPFRLDALPRDLLPHALPVARITVSPDEAFALENASLDNGRPAGVPRHDVLQGLAAVLDPHVAAFGRQAFVRLAHHAPTDSPRAFPAAGVAAPVGSGAEAISHLTSSYSRIGGLLQHLRLTHHPVTICLRPFVQDAQRRLLRIFVENGRVAALSQVHSLPDAAAPDLHLRAHDLEQALRAFAHGILLPAAGLPSFAADVLADPAQDNFGLRLLDLSPPASSGATRRCLYGPYDAFDGGLRLSPLSPPPSPPPARPKGWRRLLPFS